jgi:hypothetical protein
MLKCFMLHEFIFRHIPSTLVSCSSSQMSVGLQYPITDVGSAWIKSNLVLINSSEATGLSKQPIAAPQERVDNNGSTRYSNFVLKAIH